MTIFSRSAWFVRSLLIFGTAILLCLHFHYSIVHTRAYGTIQALTAGEEHLYPATTETAEPEKYNCTCVACEEDERCGRLWKGGVFGGEATFFEHITIVMSHCIMPLHWLPDFTKGIVVNDMTIISKCNATVQGAPEWATFERLPNVGRCDHTYAHWMKEFTKDPKNDKDDDKHVVVFLKDNRDIQERARQRSFDEMLRIASKTGFACGLEAKKYKGSGDLSAYHEWYYMKKFRRKRYRRKNQKKYPKNEAEQLFASPYKNMEDWSQRLGLPIPRDVVQVCYGGYFAVTARQIHRRADVWPNLTQSLSRANDLEEGHFAERSWAGLLANPLAPGQVEALRLHQNAHFEGPMFGALERR